MELITLLNNKQISSLDIINSLFSIIDKKDDLLGIILTHAHEDHIGAVAHIWPSLKCKMYATPFTAALILEKFKEKKIDITRYLEVVPLNSKIKLGSFEIDFVTLTHSILEPNGLSIKTPLGTVLHTGDWKIDPNPLIGGQIDEQKLKSIGNIGVSAMICDSTNIFSPGRAGSESDVRDSLFENNPGFIDFGTASIIERQIQTTIENFEPRVDNLQVNVIPRPDQNEFEVNVLFDIIGQEFPTQDFSFILQAAR